MKQFIALGCGILFGLGMVISQMVNPAVIIGFLDIFGQWDPRVILVMVGALAVFMPSYQLWLKKSACTTDGSKLELPSSNRITPRLILGAVLFGAGWSLIGLCPGPAITSLVSGSPDIWIFVVSLIIGQLATRELLQSRSTPKVPH
ncbi:YeeE/YedE family protein [Dongshaea marina]|uniref:YeeE/YedE family protein n=1 Tax=Dongshaea marina TaxID=2047966 RepID=UPI000D3E8F4A|nr:YeeE/YedE family protein [Dongshaea marina]